jgi:hypothetical protein
MEMLWSPEDRVFEFEVDEVPNECPTPEVGDGIGGVSTGTSELSPFPTNRNPPVELSLKRPNMGTVALMFPELE